MSDNNDDDDDDSSVALSDIYYGFSVDDEIDAYWGGARYTPLHIHTPHTTRHTPHAKPQTTPGDETTRRGWEHAVIVGIDDEGDDDDEIYSVIWDFNGEQVCRVVKGCGLLYTLFPDTHPHIHRPGCLATRYGRVVLATFRGVRRMPRRLLLLVAQRCV